MPVCHDRLEAYLPAHQSSQALALQEFVAQLRVVPKHVAPSMLREARMKYSREIVDGFRMRGRDVTRLESFSDAVFGFALTLLVVSLEVPKSFADLLDAMKGFPAFAVCFAVLAMVWNSHYKFSRRYSLDDRTTRFLTCVLVFIVLVYVYPLKFLFNLSINDMIFGDSAGAPVIKEGDLPMLLAIYGFGFAGFYLALTLLYLHAWRLRDALELSEIEKLDTRFGIYRLSSVGSKTRDFIGPPVL